MRNAQLKYLIERRLGFDIETLGASYVENAVRRLSESSGAQEIEDYVTRVAGSTEMMAALIEEIVVPETWFVRDSGAFDFLKNFAKKIHPEKGGPLRILSAPCSTGEEPYSIAIALHEAGLGAEDYSIEAVDISYCAIDKARAAEYTKNSMRGASNEFIEKYFDRAGDKYILKKGFRRNVEFRQANILDPGFAGSRAEFDIIFCRNLMIYLRPDSRLRLFSAVDRLLRPGGALFTGHSEIMFFNRAGYSPSGAARSFALIKNEEHDAPAAQEKKFPDTKKYLKKIRENARKDRKRPIIAPKFEIPERSKAPAAEDAISAKSVRRLADMGRYDEALSGCEQLIAERSPQAELYYLAGLINEALGNSARAAESYNKALYLDPEHYETLINLCLLSEKMGDLRKAELLRRRAQKIDFK
ncbi:MAG: CheR family methyltransferase [Candidatus Kapaibacterium sp.]